MIRSIRLSFTALLAVVALNATASRSHAAFELVLHDVNTNTTVDVALPPGVPNASDVLSYTGFVGNFFVSIDSAIGNTIGLGNPSNLKLFNTTISANLLGSKTDTLTFQVSESHLAALPNTATGLLKTEVSSLSFTGTVAGDGASVQSFVRDNPTGLTILGPLVFSTNPLILTPADVGHLPKSNSAVGPNPTPSVGTFQLEQLGALTLNAGDQGSYLARTNFITPEPATMTLWGIGLAACGFAARRRRNAKTA